MARLAVAQAGFGDLSLDQSGWDSASRPRRRELASVALTLFLQLRDARPRFRDLDQKRLDHSRQRPAAFAGFRSQRRENVIRRPDPHFMRAAGSAILRRLAPFAKAAKASAPSFPCRAASKASNHLIPVTNHLAIHLGNGFKRAAVKAQRPRMAKVMIARDVGRHRLRPWPSQRFVTATPARHHSFDCQRVPRTGRHLPA